MIRLPDTSDVCDSKVDIDHEKWLRYNSDPEEFFVFKNGLGNHDVCCSKGSGVFYRDNFEIPPSSGNMKIQNMNDHHEDTKRTAVLQYTSSNILGRRVRKRAILTAQQAVEIFKLRESPASKLEQPGAELVSVYGRSSLVSALYGISPKAVRDIWNR